MIRLHRASPVLLAALVAAAGCSDSSRSNPGTSTAPTTSGSGTAPTNSGAAPTTTAALTYPDPGGGVASLTTAAPVTATLQTDVYTALKEQSSLSDLAIPDAAGLRDRAYVVEDRGTVRVLDLSGAQPVLDRAIDLPTAPFAAGIATGALRIQDPQTALVTASGAGGEAVYLFDPSTAAGPGDVVRYDLSNLTVTWPAGTLDAAGTDVGGQPLPLSYTSDALIAGGKLLITSANFDASFVLQPGSVYAFDIDPNTWALSRPQVLRTTAFNPVALTHLLTPAGELVLVTNGGPFGTGPGSIDVLDPVSLRLLGSIGLGARNPAGRVVVRPDGKRGYVASQTAAEVTVLDLEGIGGLLTATGFVDASARYLGGFALPSTASTNLIADLALSHTGRYLYAVSFNESALHVVDLGTAGLGATVTGFARSGVPANYEGLANFVAVRPGVPGVDFQGPSLLVATINLVAADRTLQDVTTALDAVTVDRH